MICLQDSVIVLNGNYDNTCTSPPSYVLFRTQVLCTLKGGSRDAKILNYREIPFFD